MSLLLPPQGADARQVAMAVNQALKGKINAVGSVTLAAGAASTVVGNALADAGSAILLFPQTAHAAAEMAGGTLYVAPAGVVAGASFTVSHANNGQTDRVFSYVILG